MTNHKTTKKELEAALKALMRAVTSGELSGRNPWSHDAVKGASMALTGDRFGFTSDKK
jgi:DhnA family fructose-bisphosphate aldolase class Ia